MVVRPGAPAGPRAGARCQAGRDPLTATAAHRGPQVRPRRAVGLLPPLPAGRGDLRGRGSRRDDQRGAELYATAARVLVGGQTDDRDARRRQVHECLAIEAAQVGAHQCGARCLRPRRRQLPRSTRRRTESPAPDRRTRPRVRPRRTVLPPRSAPSAAGHCADLCAVVEQRGQVAHVAASEAVDAGGPGIRGRPRRAVNTHDVDPTDWLAATAVIASRGATRSRTDGPQNSARQRRRTGPPTALGPRGLAAAVPPTWRARRVDPISCAQLGRPAGVRDDRDDPSLRRRGLGKRLHREQLSGLIAVISVFPTSAGADAK